MANFNCAALLSGANFTGNVNVAANVGIGTTSPAANLDVRASTAPGYLQASAIISSGGSSDPFLFVGDNTSHGITIGHANNSGSASYGWISYWGLNPVGGAGIMITSSGYVGIGTTSPGQPLYVQGQAGGSTNWSYPSDTRLKQHVVEVKDGLTLVGQLRPVRFDWLPSDKRQVAKTLSLPTDKPQIGFIAQDVEKVVPEAVVVPTKGSDVPYELKEADLIPVMVAAIKEQQAEITELRATVADLKTKLGASPPH